MSRSIFYQSLQPNALTNSADSAKPNLVPVFSSEPSFPAQKQRYMDKLETPRPSDPSQKIVTQVHITGIQWMLATMAIREKLDNPPLQKIKDSTTRKLIDNPNRRTPVIGQLCRDVLEIIIHFGLGVSANVTGFYKNTQGGLVPVSRQSHLIERAFFAMRPKYIKSGSEILSELMLNDLLTAVKNDDRRQVAYILLKNPLYLTLENGDGVTPLSMALRTDNTVLVKMMENLFFDEAKIPDGKAIMLHQFNTVFPQGYDTHCAQQEADAKKLFIDAGIIDQRGKCILFDGVSPQDITDTLNNTPKSDSVLRPRFDNFKSLLADYYKIHPHHNDEMLALADYIYIKNFDPWTFEQLRVFSYQGIGAIQKKDKDVSLFRLKNHAQGIDYLGSEVPSDSYCLRGTSKDVRSLSSLGVSSCIDILGVAERWRRRVDRVSGQLMSSKNSMLSELVTQLVRACARKPERRCVVS